MDVEDITSLVEVVVDVVAEVTTRVEGVEVTGELEVLVVETSAEEASLEARVREETTAATTAEGTAVGEGWEEG